MFFALFVINDVDMSGTMELEEFLATLEALGKPGFDPDAAKRLMDEHDKDESGSIDANEFGQIMLNEFCQTDLPRGDLVDALYLFSKLRESAACLLLDAVLIVRQLGADLVRDDHGEVISVLRGGE